jgi:NAD(P)-dependent dehydrogenase (short-subunit alcohol dehydrogenase family)
MPAQRSQEILPATSCSARGRTMAAGSKSLGGSVGIVTGGSGGIGRAVIACAEGLGAHVACLDIVGGPAEVNLECDVTDERAVAQAVAEVERDLGPVGFLVCAAGVVSERAVSDLDVAEWRRVVDVSLLGTFLTTRAVVPSMTRNGRGRIVALSSGYATKGYRNGSHYAAAKAGVEAFVKSLALEVGQHQITVNAVAPGPVATPMLDHAPDERWRTAAASTPLGRLAEPEDVVGPVMFLLGPGAGHITGQVVHVNGGMLMP